MDYKSKIHVLGGSKLLFALQDRNAYEAIYQKEGFLAVAMFLVPVDVYCTVDLFWIAFIMRLKDQIKYFKS